MKSLVLEFGGKKWGYVVPQGQTVVEFESQVLALGVDPGHMMRNALENPCGYPRLCETLTPDDHLVIVVDDSIPNFVKLLSEVLLHIQKAGVNLENVVLLLPAGQNTCNWLEDLPEELDGVRVETHHPDDKKALCYLATNEAGERVYLNRTLVEADQVIVLGKRSYDSIHGHSGAQCDIFPAMADDQTISGYAGQTVELLPNSPSKASVQATEVAWLLGAPYFIQVIEGSGGALHDIVTGSVEASQKAEAELDKVWLKTTPAAVSTVVALVGRAGERVSFGDLCRAAQCASRVVKKQGSIVLLSEAILDLAAIRQQLEAGSSKKTKISMNPEFRMWVEAASHAKIYLASENAAVDAERLMAFPVRQEKDLVELLNGASSVLVIPDAHRSYVRISRQTKK